MPTSPLAHDLAQRGLDLVRIPSVTGDERAIAEHLERWVKHLRARPKVRRQGNGLVVGAPDGNRPSIALVGHIDTVPPHPGEAAAHLDGDRLYGLGATDMKGSLAVMQVLAEQLDWAALPFSLVLVFYDREEGAFADNGLEGLFDTCPFLQQLDFAIAMEPTDNTVQVGCVGSLHARVVFQGKAAHSARPWQGDNAVHKAWRLLKDLAERGARDVVVEGLTFRDAMSVTLAEGGRAKNVIPERFVLNINHRFAPLGSVEQAVERAKNEVRRVVGDAPDVSLEFVDVAPPGPVPAKSPFLEHLRSRGGLRIEPKQAWTDVARLAARHIDAVNFGPGETALAHQRGESISVSAMLHAYEILAQALRTPLAE